MKKTSGIVLALLLAVTGCATKCDRTCATDRVNISVFAYIVDKVAKQRGISIEEAADRLYAVGVRGFDVGPNEGFLPKLAKTKLKPINFYHFPKMFASDNGAADCRACLDRAVEYGVPRVMVVPPNFTKGGDEAAEFAEIMSGMKFYVAEAKARGITITIEDFGGTDNACSHAKYLKRLLDEIPELQFALDSGNLYYAGRGEDILEMMNYAKGRIGHVHLKDQTREDNRKYATLGLGGVPNEAVVRGVAAQGYTGWYTIENPVDDFYNDVVRQVALIRDWSR